MRTGELSGRRGRVAALGLYLLLVVLGLWPQSLRPHDTVWYVGDSLDSVYFVSWNARQLFRDPLKLFDSNILFPNPHPGALDTHRILPAILAAPIIRATGNPILATNLVTAAAYVFAALGARRLGRFLGLEPIGAWSAGALYAFHTYMLNESPRVNMLCHGFVPLAVVELLTYLDTGERRHAWRLGGLMLLQGLADNYLVLYGALVLALVALLHAAARGRATLRRLPGLLVPAACAAALFSPVALAYVRSDALYGFARDLPRGIDLWHYLSTPAHNLVYGPMGLAVTMQQRGPHFVGFVALGLAAWALLRRTAPDGPGAAMPARAWAPAAALLGLVFVALSLGREVEAGGRPLGPGPYRLLYEFVPGFSFIRIPERLSLMAMLFLGLLAGRGVSLARAALGTVPAVLLAATIPFEHLAPLPFTQRMPVGDDIPLVYRWLAAHPVRAMAEVPTHGEYLIRKESIEEYFSTFHERPLIHGYVSYPPLLSVLLRRAAGEFPSTLSIDALTRVGVDTVVVHEGRAAPAGFGDAVRAAAAAGAIQPLARFDGPGAKAFDGGADQVYRLPPRQPIAAAPQPGGRVVRGPAWRWRAKDGDAHHAGDGDPATSWRVSRPLRGDEFLEVTFGGEQVEVVGVTVPLRRDSAFPTRFRIAGRDAQGGWTELAPFDDAHVAQLVDQLRVTPASAVLGFSLAPRHVTGISFLPSEGGTSVDGWALHEVEIRVR